MSRPPGSLLSWLRPHQSLSPAPPTLLSSSATTRLSARKTHPPNNQTAPTTKQSFHSTQPRPWRGPGARSPAAMRAQNQVTYNAWETPAGPMDKNGFYLHLLSDSHEEHLKEFLQNATPLFRLALSGNQVPKGINFQKFKEVGTKLVVASHRALPNAQAIRAISSDVDAVYRLGHIVSHDDRPFWEWVTSSCAMAKARIPLIIITKRNMDHIKVPPHTEWTDEIKKMATESKFPPAMLLQAEILLARGRPAEAASLLKEHVLPYCSSTQRAPTSWEDITLGGRLISPWRLYATCTGLEGNGEAMQKAIRTAAMTYQEGQALAEQATMMRVQGDMEAYEEYMTKAATTGLANPCLFLANFYLATALGYYPTRAERKAGTPPPKSQSNKADEQSSGPNLVMATLKSMTGWASSYFNQSMPRENYRKLAVDWYELAYAHKNAKAALILAFLMREDGDLETGLHLLEMAEKKPGDIQRLKPGEDSWHAEEYARLWTRRMTQMKQRWHEPNLKSPFTRDLLNLD